MTIRDFFENYYDGQGPVCVVHAIRVFGVRAFWVDQGLANSHTTTVAELEVYNRCEGKKED